MMDLASKHISATPPASYLMSTFLLLLVEIVLLSSVGARFGLGLPVGWGKAVLCCPNVECSPDD